MRWYVHIRNTVYGQASLLSTVCNVMYDREVIRAALCLTLTQGLNVFLVFYGILNVVLTLNLLVFV